MIFMKRLHLPLSALRAFEAAARHESFAGAAEELSITQPAVSKQVVALEERLGMALFERAHRSVHLTPRGRMLAPRISDAFDRMTLALEDVLDDVQPSNTLTIAVESDFARLWLLPRLAGFERRVPDLSVSIVAQIDPDGLDERVSDCAVLWGGGWWKDCDSEPLFTNAAFPVCSPALAERLRNDKSTLCDLRLIHDRTTDWWKRAALELDLPELDWTAGPVYNQTTLCLEAALKGDGVTIGDEVSSSQYLADGALEMPFDLFLSSPASYYLLWKRRSDTARNVLAFRDWLVEQAMEHRKWMAEYWQNQSG